MPARKTAAKRKYGPGTINKAAQKQLAALEPKPAPKKKKAARKSYVTYWPQ